MPRRGIGRDVIYGSRHGQTGRDGSFFRPLSWTESVLQEDADRVTVQSIGLHAAASRLADPASRPSRHRTRPWSIRAKGTAKVGIITSG